MTVIKALFLDIGGVLMTNGWGHQLREQTAQHFNVEYAEMNRRHQLVFDTYETGKTTFDEYLERTIFYEKRDFEMQEVKQYIFDAVRPFDDMISYIKEIKKRYGLKVGVVSNEGRELAVDRIQRFDLSSFVDFFVVSSFVHFRKPDLDIYRLAIDVAQVPPTEICYIDDRELLIEVSKGVGLQGIHHRGLDSTRAILEKWLSSN